MTNNQINNKVDNQTNRPFHNPKLIFLMKKIASILLGILMLSAGLPLFGQTDTNFRKQGEEVFLFRRTQELKNHDSLTITTEQLLAKWQIANDCRPLNLEDYKQLLQGKSVIKQDTSSKTIITSILPVRKAYIINSTEHQTQSNIISAKKSSQLGEESACWFWTILGIIIPAAVILLYGFIGLDKKNKDFIIAYLFNLAIMTTAGIIALIAQPPSVFLWMILSIVMLFIIYKFSDLIYNRERTVWPAYHFYQFLLMAGITASWFMTYIMENPENIRGKHYLSGYLIAFVGLHALSFAIRISLNKLRKKMIKHFRG